MLPQFLYLFLMDLTKIPTKTFDQYSSNEPGFSDSMLQAYLTAFSAPYFLFDFIDDQIVCLDKNGDLAPQETLDSLCANPNYECIVHSGLSQKQNTQELTWNALQKVFDEFDADIRIAMTEDQKIYAIAKQIQHIAQAHPFDDGNIRTAYIALNKLLKDYGLRLSILIDPNRLDCCDLKLIVDMIKEGQDIYTNLVRHRDPNMFYAVTSDPYFKTISCPPYEIHSALYDTFLSDVVLKESTPSIETCNTTFFNPAANQKIIDKFQTTPFNNPQCRALIAKHINAEKYGTALRNVCLHREYAAIHFLLDNIPHLDLNGQSKDGNTALDWLETHEENEEIVAIKSRLIELGGLTKSQIVSIQNH